MILTNFHRYESLVKADDDELGFKNYQALNMLSAIFSMMLSLINCLLITLTVQSKLIKYTICGILLSFQIGSLVYTNFIFSKMSSHAWTALIIAIVYFTFLLPFYAYVI